MVRISSKGIHILPVPMTFKRALRLLVKSSVAKKPPKISDGQLVEAKYGDMRFLKDFNASFIVKPLFIYLLYYSVFINHSYF
jgi:hypothetical protein